MSKEQLLYIEYSIKELLENDVILSKIEELYSVCFPEWQQNLKDKKYDHFAKEYDFLNYTNGKYKNAIWNCLFVDKKLIGFITIGHHDTMAMTHLYNGCIHPEYRNQGYVLQLFGKTLKLIFDGNIETETITTNLDELMTKERISKHSIYFPKYHFQFNSDDNLLEIFKNKED